MPIDLNLQFLNKINLQQRTIKMRDWNCISKRRIWRDLVLYCPNLDEGSMSHFWKFWDFGIFQLREASALSTKSFSEKLQGKFFFLWKHVPLNFLYGSSIVTENLNMGSMCLTYVLYQDLLWLASIIQILIFTYFLFLDCTVVLTSFFLNLNISWCVL